MKKIVPGLILATVLVLTIFPLVANGQQMLEQCTIRKTQTTQLEECKTLKVGGKASYEDYAICCLMDKIYLITDWIFTILLAITIIFVLYGGFLYMTAGGVSANIERGRNYIKYALIGFLIAVLAKALPRIIYYFVK